MLPGGAVGVAGTIGVVFGRGEGVIKRGEVAVGAGRRVTTSVRGESEGEAERREKRIPAPVAVCNTAVPTAPKSTHGLRNTFRMARNLEGFTFL
jgi:hypothetical protein